MKKYLYIISIIILCFSNSLYALDNWKVFNTYKSYTQLEEFHGDLYVRSGNAVFYTNPDNDATDSFTKIDGISSSQVQFLAKSEKADILAFIHDDGIVDLMDSNHNISSIYDFKNKSIVGNKTINNYTICGDKLYLACGFGFVEIDISKQLITNYYQTKQDCNIAFYFADSYYYGLTTGGLWRCEGKNNLSVDSNWRKIEDRKVLDVAVFNNQEEDACWIVDEAKDIHILNPDGSYKRTSSRKCYERLKHSGNFIFSKGWGFDIIRTDNQDISHVQQSPYGACRDYYSANDSILYAVHPEKGLVKLKINFKSHALAEIEQLSESNNYYEIAGSQISELAYNNGTLAGISGYKMYSAGYTEMYLANASVSFFENDQWSHITEQDVLSQKLASKEFRGLTNIASDPLVENRFFVSTLTTGIYQFDTDSLTAHFFPNERITAITCDDEGNLWAARSFSDTTFYVKKTGQDNWRRFKIEGFSLQPNVARIIRQENESHRLIWALNNYPYHNSKIAILYIQGAIEDGQKVQTATISSLQDQDGNLYSLSNAISTIFDIHEDNEGKIWLLTNIGPFVIEDVVTTFNNAQKTAGIGIVKRIKVPRNDGSNLADYLLATSSCTAMVSDQFNRKWIGTKGEGLYLLSNDGFREIAHFIVENSPLHSNDITSLAYIKETNQLSIACDGGIIIYDTTDNIPSTDFSSFHCYPNPLRPDYYGDIEISGLMSNTLVTITDSAGNLIWKNLCQDGKTSWDARDNSGNRVAPGVYLIHGISEDTNEGEICKLLVL